MNKLITLEPKVLEIIQELKDRGNLSLIVGGAVRDSILGIEAKDVDIEVYAINYNDLMEFLSKHGRVDLVGKKFGVIVFNPKGCEMKYDFSVPRRENKVGVGHAEFEISFDENISIKEAALRRDTSWNALAYDPITNEIHDFFNGVEDLKNRIIRHTSDKFKEDYLRIARLQQFQSRFDFEIHPSTIEIVKEMLSNNNEFNLLSKERLCEEWLKWAEKGIRHDNIFKFLRDTTLIDFYPELKALKETPQDEVFHPEGHVEFHTELCLKRIDEVIKENNITGTEKIIIVMATLMHDIAKPYCTEEQMKRGRMTITSNGHEEMGAVVARKFLESIGFHESLILPICNLVANHLAGVNISMIPALSGKTKAVKKLSRKLHPANIQQLLYLMHSDTNGRGSDEIKEATGSQDIKEIASQITVVTKQYEYLLMGRHLIKFGLKPSSEFGIILKASYEAQEEGLFHDLEGANKWLNDNFKLLTSVKC